MQSMNNFLDRRQKNKAVRLDSDIQNIDGMVTNLQTDMDHQIDIESNSEKEELDGSVDPHQASNMISGVQKKHLRQANGHGRGKEVVQSPSDKKASAMSPQYLPAQGEDDKDY